MTGTALVPTSAVRCSIIFTATANDVPLDPISLA
jgi:hypothetical protein